MGKTPPKKAIKGQSRVTDLHTQTGQKNEQRMNNERTKKDIKENNSGSFSTLFKVKGNSLIFTINYQQVCLLVEPIQSVSSRSQK